MLIDTRYSRKNRNMAVFLCVFLGLFGIHRFYLGKPITALIWMFTGGFFFVGWILDIIVILFAEEMKDGKGFTLRPSHKLVAVQYSERSRGVTVLLCAFLGAFGIRLVAKPRRIRECPKKCGQLRKPLQYPRRYDMTMKTVSFRYGNDSYRERGGCVWEAYIRKNPSEN